MPASTASGAQVAEPISTVTLRPERSKVRCGRGPTCAAAASISLTGTRPQALPSPAASAPAEVTMNSRRPNRFALAIKGLLSSSLARFHLGLAVRDPSPGLLRRPPSPLGEGCFVLGLSRIEFLLPRAALAEPAADRACQVGQSLRHLRRILV